MTLAKPLGLPLLEGHRLTLGKPLGLGMPYSLLLTPNSHLPSPTWFRSLYLTSAARLKSTGGGVDG